MTFVGSLIKNTTKVGYQYSNKRKKYHPDQEKVLEHLVNKAKRTSFGKIYNFSSIDANNPGELATVFAERLPIFTYERLYNEFYKFQLKGSTGVTWPSKIDYYALTSGTTQGGSKRIPVSEQMIKQFQKTSFQQVLSLHELNLPPSFFKSSILTLGGSTRLESVNGHWEGDLSGILQRNKSMVYKLFTKPGSSIGAIKNWHIKKAAIVKHAKKWDIGVIAGSPVWVNQLIEAIVHEYKVNTIHDIWPNLTLFLHGGVFLGTYRESIGKYCKRELIYLDTYLSSEGYFAYQKRPEDDGMSLLTKHGVYYEFVEERYFDQLSNERNLDSIPTINLSEVEVNKPYALIISTSAGIWRYSIGDVVRFTSVSPFLLKIDGRIKHTMNIAGEHLSLENMNEAVLATNKEFGVSTEEYCVLPASDNSRHHWYIGSNQVVKDVQSYMLYLDRNLSLLNDDYKSTRKYYLAHPTVTFLPLQKFYEYMEREEKIGGQHKFPRVLNRTQASNWLDFLSRLD